MPPRSSNSKCSLSLVLNSHSLSMMGSRLIAPLDLSMFKWAGKASKIPATTALLSKSSHAGADVVERGRHGGGER